MQCAIGTLILFKSIITSSTEVRFRLNIGSTTDQTKIIVPTVYREDYLGGLRRLTRDNDPKVFIRMMERAQAFSHIISGNDMDAMEDALRASNAFQESNEGVLKIVES